MSKYSVGLSLVLCVLLASGCAAAPKRLSPDAPSQAAKHSPESLQAGERILIRTASMNVEVPDPRTAAAQAETLAKGAGGYVERSAAREEAEIDLTLRVPESELDRLLEAFAELGKVTYRSEHAEDVTEQVIDADARITNLRATRDRLRAQLDRATSVKDIVAVEAELSRVQADLDSLEGRLKYLKGKAALSEVTLTFERKMLLGPLGYISWALWWTVSKLFVIR
jgi:hypothetical protein